MGGVHAAKNTRLGSINNAEKQGAEQQRNSKKDYRAMVIALDVNFSKCFLASASLRLCASA